MGESLTKESPWEATDSAVETRSVSVTADDTKRPRYEAGVGVDGTAHLHPGSATSSSLAHLLNGEASTSTVIPSQGKMRRKHRLEGERTCRVCGDRAVAYNFDVISCESCKTFFRRNAFKAQKTCQLEGRCDISVKTRRFCPSCRLKKCLELGMKADMILDEEERRARMEKIRNNRVKRQEVYASQNAFQTEKLSQTTSDIHNVDFLLDPDSVLDIDLLLSELTEPPPCLENGLHQELSRDRVEPAGSPADIAATPESLLSVCGSSSTLSTSGVDSPPNGLSAVPSENGVVLRGDFLTLGKSGCHNRLTGGPCAKTQGTNCCCTQSASCCCCCPFLEGSCPKEHWQAPDGQIKSRTNAADGTNPRSLQLDCCPAQCPNAVTKRGRNTWAESLWKFERVGPEELPTDPGMYRSLTADELHTIEILESACKEVFAHKMELLLPEELLDQLKRLSLQDSVSAIDRFGSDIVGFVKKMPDFAVLDICDLEAMLSANAMSALCVLSTMSYSRERKAWLKQDGVLPLDVLAEVFQDDEVVEHLGSVNGALKRLLGQELTPFVLLLLIAILDPRAARLRDRQTASTLQDRYWQLLKHYLESRFSYQHAGRCRRAVEELLEECQTMGAQMVAGLSMWKVLTEPLVRELRRRSPDCATSPLS